MKKRNYIPSTAFQKKEMPKPSLSQNELPQLGRTLRIGILFRLMLSRVADPANDDPMGFDYSSKRAPQLGQVH